MDVKPWHKHWPKGLSLSLDYPEATVDIILRTAAYKFTERVALVFQGAEYTYSELWSKAQRFAAALAGLGIRKGDVVVLHMPNCPQFVIAYYGLFLAGAVFCPANPMLSPRELKYQLSDSRARVVVTFEHLAPLVLSLREQTDVEYVIVTNETEAVTQKPSLSAEMKGKNNVFSFQHLQEQYLDIVPRVELDPKSDLAHLAYTGGTTGISKGVMLTHYNVLVNAIQWTCWTISGRPVVKEGVLYIEDKYDQGDGGEYFTEEGKDVTINVTPWYHAMGTNGFLNRLLLRGFTIYLHPRFDPVAYLNDAEKYQVTYIGGAPPLYLAMLNTPHLEKRNLKSVVQLSSGAAPLAVELIDRLKRIFPNAIIIEAYGLTEVTMGATNNPVNRSGLRKTGTVGIPIYDTDIKIVDLETGENELPLGKAGEICVKGPQCMQGYLNRPQETAAVLRDGWVYTGDIGFMDEDGYLTIVDRKKDMLIYKGYNVYPRELEELLFQHPAVANCTVIGVADPAVGEYPKAFVVKKSGSEVTREELMDYVNNQVIFYKKLRSLEFIHEIPVSPAGKVLKRVLREREKNQSKAGPHPNP